MYLVYSKKQKWDTRDEYPLNAQIKFLAFLFENQCWIFSLPGYMSDVNKAGEYLTEFNKLVCCNNKQNSKEQYIGFGNGYGSPKRRQEYIDWIEQMAEKDPMFMLRNYNVIIGNCQISDHSKMLFYYKWKDTDLQETFINKTKSLSANTIDDFINAIDTKAVIIGSSNQSYNTYFSKKADKGESDILLLASDYGNEIKDEKSIIFDMIHYHNHEKQINDNEKIIDRFLKLNVFSKTLFQIEKNKSDEEYLNEMFRKCLKKGLSKYNVT